MVPSGPQGGERIPEEGAATEKSPCRMLLSLAFIGQWHHSLWQSVVRKKVYSDGVVM